MSSGNLAKIDIANIFLMIGSCLAAFFLPFELLLFSYAVLGPLHYLTEISWLHKKQYFTTGKLDYVLFVIIVFLLLIFNLFPEKYPNATDLLIFVAFFYAAMTVVFKNIVNKLILTAIATMFGIAFKGNHSFAVLFGIFLPTIIHVFLFTWLFVLYGALKSRSITGMASLVVFICCAVSFFIFQPQCLIYQISSNTEKALVNGGFVLVNQSILELFRMGKVTKEILFESDIGFSVMRLIAFSYTYHYLNWFSKTQIIKWHEVPKRQLSIIVTLWVFSVMLYALDYNLGLIALYFLSMLHVLMEFPLNYRTFIGLGVEMKKIIKT